MSYMFEAVVVPLGAPVLNSEHVSSGTFLAIQEGQAWVLVRRAGRQDDFNPELLDTVARALSGGGGWAVAAAYDDRIGFRTARLWRSSVRTHEFGPDEEVWVPLDEQGEPLSSARGLLLRELDPDEEHECLHNAIDLALLEAAAPRGLSCALVRDLASKR